MGSGGVEATWEHSSRGKAPTVHALAFRHDASTTSTMHHGGPSAIPSVGGHWNNWCLLPSARWEMPYREQVQPQRSRFRQRQWRMSKAPMRVIVFAPRAGEAPRRLREDSLFPRRCPRCFSHGPQSFSHEQYRGGGTAHEEKADVELLPSEDGILQMCVRLDLQVVILASVDAGRPGVRCVSNRMRHPKHIELRK